jgi:hypothetical protein
MELQVVVSLWKSGASTRCEVGVCDVRFITKGLCEWK